MADGVENCDRAVLSALQFWREMMAALQLRRDFALAERADFHRRGEVTSIFSVRSSMFKSERNDVRPLADARSYPER